MASELEQLKKDVARLASCVALLQAEMERLTSENKRLTCERDQLKQTIAALLRRIYGARSEKLDPNQLLLDLGVLAALSIDDSDDDEPPPPPRRRKQRGKAVALPENLPEERTVIDPEEVLANPDAYECIGEVEHVELDVNPMRVFKRVTVRRKYRLKDRSAAPVIAPAPKQIIPNSKASAGLLAYIVESKYIDHLPLFRQEQIFRRYGVELGASG